MSEFLRDHQDLAERLRVMRALGRRVVFTNGCFDILHVGHIRSLQDAKSRGDILVIGINSDRSVAALKGPSRPVIPEDERVEILCALRVVDYVTIFDDETADALLEKLRPDIYAKGSDYTPDTVPERNTVLSYGGEIAICGDPKDHSTREILERVGKMAPPPPSAPPETSPLIVEDDEPPALIDDDTPYIQEMPGSGEGAT